MPVIRCLLKTLSTGTDPSGKRWRIVAAPVWPYVWVQYPPAPRKAKRR